MKIVLFSVIFFLHLQLWAMPSPTQFTLQVHFGDKSSTFKIWQEGSQGYFSYSANDGRFLKKKLSSKNYNFLSAQVKSLKEIKSNDAHLCSSQVILLNGSEFEKAGCLGSKTPISAKLTELANTLNLLI